MKIILLIYWMLGTVCVAVAANNSEDAFASEGKGLNEARRFIPDEIKAPDTGVTYRFNQKVLQNMLNEYLDSYTKDLAANSKELTRDKAALAFGIIAAGQFASPTKEISDFLLKVDGLMGNVSLPPGVLSPYAALVGMASVSFTDNDGNSVPPEIDPANPGDGDFKSIIWIAEAQLAARANPGAPEPKVLVTPPPQ